MAFFDAPYVVIDWDEQIGCSVAHWRGFAQSADYRQGLDKVLELLQAHKATKALADLRDQKPATEADQQWTNENWFPRAIAIGLNRMAVVIPKSQLANMALTKIMSNVNDQEFNTAYFDDVEEAKKWLASNN